MTNFDITDNIQINGTEIEKVTNYTCLGQTIAIGNGTKQEVSTRIKTGWSGFLFFCFFFGGGGGVQINLSGQAPSHESKKKCL